MPKEDFKYEIEIERGHSEINDRIIDFLKTKIDGNYLDVGCNTGFLLSEVPDGIGVDASSYCVDRAIEKGLHVLHTTGDNLPFASKSFDVVVLSCVLEQCDNWRDVLDECKRVGLKVIGINPLPHSPWGVIGGYVKSIIPPEILRGEYGATIGEFDKDRYYFEI